MKRLKDITCSQLEEWRNTRAAIGRKKYKDKHLKRYGLVDVMEELLDAENIIKLIEDRMLKQGYNVQESLLGVRLASLECLLDDVKQAAIDIDDILEDKYCTDEEGGDRIWWND